MGAKTLLTVEHLERLPEAGDVSYELDQGELVEVSSASYLHNRIRDRLGAVKQFVALTGSRAEWLDYETRLTARVTTALPLAGGEFGRYRLRESIGRGSMGIVYRASLEDSGPSVAIKTVANHRAKLMAKTGAANGPDLVRLSMIAGI